MIDSFTLAVEEPGDIESVIITFKMDGETYELVELELPVTATLEQCQQQHKCDTISRR